MTLAEEAKTWSDKGRYSVGQFGRRREFWRKGGLWRNHRFEISNSLGLSFGYSKYDEHHTFHLHLLWPNVYIKFDAKERGDCEDGGGYQVTVGKQDVTGYWGGKFKSWTYPWCIRGYQWERLQSDGTWAVAHKSEKSDYSDNQYQIVEEWVNFAGGDRQEGVALILVDRRRWTPKWRGLFTRDRWKNSIEVTFSREVGSEAGSWKGGTIGCSEEIKKGETPRETFRRMMGEKKFR